MNTLSRFCHGPAFCFLIILLLGYVGSVGASEALEGRVVGVHDGDTVTLLIESNRQIKVRLAQIDAPESDQAYGQRSKQSLADMVFNKTIRVDVETTDKYGRTVGTIYVDGLDANKEQIKRGMAWVYRQYLHDQSLLPLEEEARRAKAGLWADPNPMPPWEYRHGGAGTNRDRANPPSVNENRRGKASEPVANLPNACGNKRTCREMSSCDEAKFYLSQCGLSRLDGDGDGTPCESLCRR
jgi:endonuclease YncB( thermonuclease family)